LSLSKRVLFFPKYCKMLVKKVISDFRTDKGKIPHESELDSNYWTNFLKSKGRYLVEQVRSIIDSVKPDVIQVDLIEFLDIVLMLPPHIKKVFVHHEIRFARLESVLKSENRLGTIYDEYIINFIKAQEAKFLTMYDGVVVFSEEDRNKLKNELPNTSIVALPFSVLDKYFQNINMADLKIEKLVFIGGEIHTPNKDAIDWYISDIAKEVNRENNLCLHVIGHWTKETKEKYANRTDVYFAGFVDDVITYCKNSIMVVPVRIGSGIRTKILYAMAQGVPIVSASVGCEGIIAKHGSELMVADSPEDFAKAINKICLDENFAYQLAINAQKIAYDHYSQKVVGESRLDYYREILTH